MRMHSSEAKCEPWLYLRELIYIQEKINNSSAQIRQLCEAAIRAQHGVLDASCGK